MWRLLLVLVAVAGLIGGCTPKAGPEAPQQARQPVVLRYGDCETGEALEPAKKMVERFNQRAGGRYSIELHHVSELCEIPEILDAVRTGAVEMCYMPLGVFTTVEPRFISSELPLLFNSMEASVEALDKLIPLWSEIMEQRFNQKMVAGWIVPPLEVVLANKPIRKLDDWRGKVIQSISPSISDTISILGGSPVALPWTEAYSSLQKGVVDGAVASTMQVVLYNLNDVAKYVSCSYLFLAPNVVTINLDIWNSMPQEIQKILLEEWQTTSRERNEYFIRKAKENLDTMRERGMEVILLEKAERDRYVQAVKPYVDQAIADMGDFGQRVKQIADEVNAKYAYPY